VPSADVMKARQPYAFAWPGASACWENAACWRVWSLSGVLSVGECVMPVASQGKDVLAQMWTLACSYRTVCAAAPAVFQVFQLGLRLLRAGRPQLAGNPGPIR